MNIAYAFKHVFSNLPTAVSAMYIALYVTGMLASILYTASAPVYIIALAVFVWDILCSVALIALYRRYL